MSDGQHISPRRVVQINAVYGTGSTGRNCLELDERAAENGIEMYTAYSIPAAAEPKHGYQIGGSGDRTSHALLSRTTGLQGYFSHSPTRRLIRYLENLRPSVIHLNNLHANYVNLPLLFSYIAERRISTVLTLHDCWFYTGRCMHYTTENCDRWLAECGKCPRLSRDNPSWFFDRSSRMLTDKFRWYSQISGLAVVGVSEWITAEAKKSELGDIADFHTIYNWVDLTSFRPSHLSAHSIPANIADGKFMILGVASRWNESKGLSLFLQLAELIGPDEVLVLVGAMPPDTLLPDNVINVKATDSIELLASLFSRADVFVNFSKEETFGKVSAESLACGTPVITNKFTANPELIGPNCGHIAREVSAHSYDVEINNVRLRGKGYYTKYCREFAERNFERSANMAMYYNLYKSMIYKAATP